MNSVDREHPILIGAVVIVLMGNSYDDDLDQFAQFTWAMECFDYSTEDCYHIVEDIDDQYLRKQ